MSEVSGSPSIILETTKKSTNILYCSQRPVGFDRDGRTVLYMCFEQQATDTNHVEDTMAHVVYTMENARRMRDAFLSGRARSTDSPPASASASAPTSGSGAAGGTGEGNGSQGSSEHPSSMRDGAPFVILIFDCTGMEEMDILMCTCI